MADVIPQSRDRVPYCLLVVGALLLTGVALRIIAARDELWLDEVWSALLARQAETFTGLFTVARHDNNHLLNGMMVLLMGRVENPRWYRLPALLCGFATLVLAWRIGRERSALVGVTALALFTFSYPFINYAAEARGYAYAVVFALVAFWALRRRLQGGPWWLGLVHSLACCLGVLGQLSFLHVMPGLVLWLLADRLRRRNIRLALTDSLLFHLLPVLFMGWLYWFFVRDMVIGGARTGSMLDSTLTGLALTAGLPHETGWRWLVIPVMLAWYVHGLWTIYRRDRLEAGAMLVLSLLGPWFIVVVTQPPFFYPRYILVPLAFVLLIWAESLAALLRWRGVGPVLVGVVAAVMLWFHAARFGQQVHEGRSHYQAMLQYIVSHSGGDTITIGSSHDGSTARMLGFWAMYLRGRVHIRFVNRENWTPQGVQWYFLIDRPLQSTVPPTWTDSFGNHYDLVRRTRGGILSGFTVGLYRQRE